MGIVAALLVLSAILAWLSVPRLLPDFQIKLRDSMSIFGFLVGTIGFPLAFWQLARTQRAAAAAEEAVEKAKDAWASYDARNELSRSLTFARVSMDHLANEKWQSAANSLDEFNLSLSRISALGKGLSAEDVESIRNEMAEIVSLVSAFDELGGGDPPPRLLRRTKLRIRKQRALLSEIEIRFQGSVK